MSLYGLPDIAPELLAFLGGRQASRAETGVIQPAEPFLDMAGDDLRRRIFLTESETGASLCLRPEFTIPVCLDHIANHTTTPKRYFYLGQVFRQRRDGPNEFFQAGIEDLGATDTARADARALADALAALKAVMPGASLVSVMGDQSVFEAVVTALGLPDGWRKRLIHAFGQPEQLQALIARLAKPEPLTGLGDRVTALIEAGDVAGLERYIDATMEDTGYSTNASRKPSEIAARLIEKRALAGTALDAEHLKTLEAYLAIDCPLAQAKDALSAFAAKSGLDLEGALSAFGARISALGAEGIDAAQIAFRARFGRPLDYYTGMVFEITAVPGGPVLAGGGRYDRMLTLLGAEHHIPAVGFALWLDRIEKARAR